MIPVPLVIAGVVVGAAVVSQLRSRTDMARQAAQRGGHYTENADEIATTFTLPPFVQLQHPGALAHLIDNHAVSITQVATFPVSGSQAMSFRLVTMTGASRDSAVEHHVVALDTRQHLPRTMARAGIDIYSLPLYEGMQRIREPKRPLRGGLLSIISDDPDRAAHLPYETLTRELGLDHGLTFAADGDWIYLFRRGNPHAFRVDSMLQVLQRFARAIEYPQWPGPDDPARGVYGAVR